MAVEKSSYKASSFLLGAIFLATAAWAAVGGSISGTVKDATGGVIPGAMITVTNAGIRTEFKTVTDARGYFSFPNLAVGRYDLAIEATGFKPQKKNGLVIDVNTALEVNATLEVGDITQEVSVSTDVAAVDQEAVRVFALAADRLVSGIQSP